MRPNVTDSSLWVGLSVTLVSPARTAAPIVMPFGLRTRVGPGNQALDEARDPLVGRGNFDGGKGSPICGGDAALC